MSTKEVVIYGRIKPVCQFCKMAAQTLDNLGMKYEYKDLGKFEWDPAELARELGRDIKTIPQIVIDGEYVGGFDNLLEWLKNNSIEK